MDRLTEFENRLTAVEGAVASVRQELTDFRTGIDDKLDTLIVYVTGFNKVLGFTKRNWKTVLTFGAGVMSAAGIGNPRVWEFIQNFAF